MCWAPAAPVRLYAKVCIHVGRYVAKGAGSTRNLRSFRVASGVAACSRGVPLAWGRPRDRLPRIQSGAMPPLGTTSGLSPCPTSPSLTPRAFGEGSEPGRGARRLGVVPWTERRDARRLGLRRRWAGGVEYGPERCWGGCWRTRTGASRMRRDRAWGVWRTCRVRRGHELAPPRRPEHIDECIRGAGMLDYPACQPDRARRVATCR